MRFLIGLFAISFAVSASGQMQVGAEQTAMYFPMLRDKRVAVVANPTSLVGQVHLVDTLKNSGIKVVKIFGPEHGFRGNQGNGDHVQNEVDKKTGIPIISLYGKHVKPSVSELKNVDAIVFDMQDVGVRFYTYLSTMHYILEVAAENNLNVIVLDRPNPNDHYIDGPVMHDTTLYSLVGMHPIPIVHGCTFGELAQMIVGENWLKSNKKCKLTVIPCAGYYHGFRYDLPIPPSPNLKSETAVLAYPSLCWFEGTVVSVGRGTSKPFERIGFPGFTNGTIEFIPKNIPGVSTNPPYMNQTCDGIEIKRNEISNEQLDLKWLLTMFQAYPAKDKFFSSPTFFDKLAGTKKLRNQIIQGMSEEEIRKTWQDDLNSYKQLRKKYLLYADSK
jgi:uncharacterized protein YbbC (DUF1343 family)